MMPFRVLRLTGRGREGEKDAGVLFHAVPQNSNRALCGAKPGKHSEWWPFHEDSPVTCRECWSAQFPRQS